MLLKDQGSFVSPPLRTIHVTTTIIPPVNAEISVNTSGNIDAPLNYKMQTKCIQ
jgi:hypothetical protein